MVTNAGPVHRSARVRRPRRAAPARASAACARASGRCVRRGGGGGGRPPPAAGGAQRHHVDRPPPRRTGQRRGWRHAPRRLATPGATLAAVPCVAAGGGRRAAVWEAARRWRGRPLRDPGRRVGRAAAERRPHRPGRTARGRAGGPSRKPTPGGSAARAHDRDGTPMVVPAKAGETPVQPITVWANQTQKSASLLGRDSPLVGGTTIAVAQLAGHAGVLFQRPPRLPTERRASRSVRHRCSWERIHRLPRLASLPPSRTTVRGDMPSSPSPRSLWSPITLKRRRPPHPACSDTPRPAPAAACCRRGR